MLIVSACIFFFLIVDTRYTTHSACFQRTQWSDFALFTGCDRSSVWRCGGGGGSTGGAGGCIGRLDRGRLRQGRAGRRWDIHRCQGRPLRRHQRGMQSMPRSSWAAANLLFNKNPLISPPPPSLLRLTPPSCGGRRRLAPRFRRWARNGNPEAAQAARERC